MNITMDIFEQCDLPANASQAETERWYKKALEPVGAALSHTRGVGTTESITSATAIANYIGPELQREFFLQRKLRVPSFIPKIGD